MNDTNSSRFVIPGLPRNLMFSWIPAFAGMTCSIVINDAVHECFTPNYELITPN